jgi:hypothetical protein
MVWRMLGELSIENLSNTLLNSTLDNMIIALLSSTKRWVFRNSLLGCNYYLNCQIFSIGHSHHFHPYQLLNNFKSFLASPFSHKMGMGAYMDASSNGVLVSWKDIIDKRSCEIKKPSHSILFKEPKWRNWGQSRCLHCKWPRQCDHLKTRSRSFFLLVVFVIVQLCPSSFLSISWCIWRPPNIWPTNCLMVDFGGRSNIIVPSNFGSKFNWHSIYLWYDSLKCVIHFCIDKTCQKIWKALQYYNGSLVFDQYIASLVHAWVSISST